MNERIVLLPGFLCDERLWAYHAEQFRSSGYEVFVVDFKSAPDLEFMISQIENAMSEKSHLVGFSMGGYLAQIFALRHPEKIKSLTLVAANVGRLSENSREARLKMVDMLYRVSYKGMSEKEAERYIYPGQANQAEVVSMISQMSAGYSSQMYINHAMATMDREELGAQISALNLPVMIISAEDDKVVPIPMLERLHREIDGSKFKVIKQCGHYVPLEQPEELYRLLKDWTA
jgi:Predicted hydrolases or acyltransferases (alpha/beta hydrolase superfamily)